uniref:Quinolinate synthase, chloroplastic n=1 Tax=Kalanchoe fedtschenkoi TaxID=63787 RepID=A0A7N0VFG7_KALFE
MDSSSAAMAIKSTIFSTLPTPKLSKPASFKPTSSTSRSRLVNRIRIQSIQNPSPDSPNPPFRNPSSSSQPSPSTFSRRAVVSTPTPPMFELASSKDRLRRLVTEFQSLPEPLDRVKRLLRYAALLPEFPASSKADGNRVMGCTAQVWLTAELDEEGRVRFKADSDSEITRGFCSCLIWVLDGAAPEEVLEMKTDDFGALSVVGLAGNVSSRVNTWHNVLISMQKKCRALMAERDGRPKFEPFPSMVVTAEGITAQGAYAEAQARFLYPDEKRIEELVSVLKEKEIGVVAHFYMDPEVQGVLTAAQKHWPHIFISDSLVMADAAVKMAQAGCKFIAVLGVDFMSENVRAILDQAGFGEVGVYRMSNERIGCSLADAAAAPAYLEYLREASTSSPSLHVVYINTSLETKAHAHELVPTITCTSSNVVQTILQAFAQVPNLNVWYGPDTYMGANIVELFQQMLMMTDDEISQIHPGHNKKSIRSLLPRLHYFPDGTCIVHHLFGQEVVDRINEMYCDAFLTAHFEVPGEMFSLAMEAKRRGMGVVGSTQNILDFINQRVQEALGRNIKEHLKFVLGTESGMITSIVASVRKLFSSAKSSLSEAEVSVEIIFPVSSESITQTAAKPNASVKFGDLALPVLPGVASGEGCSINGGCASCPYMKMNSLTSLLRICHKLPDKDSLLSAYEAGRFDSQTPLGNSVADVGCEPILHMRQFQSHKKLPEKLIHQILAPAGNGKAKS